MENEVTVETSSGRVRAEGTAIDTAHPPAPGPAIDTAIEEELLIEEISIDGMCGVY
jgi:mycofactocin precursor